jgi:hypothetical protein
MRRRKAAVRKNDVEKRTKNARQRGEYQEHIEVLERNVREHEKRILSITPLPEEESEEGEQDSSRPKTEKALVPRGSQVLRSIKEVTLNDDKVTGESSVIQYLQMGRC